MKRIQSWKRSA